MSSTVLTVKDENSGEKYTGDLYDAIDWMRTHWLTDDVLEDEECREAFEEAVDLVEEQMQCAAFAEKQRARGSDSYYMPDAGWANTYLGVSVSLETPEDE